MNTIFKHDTVLLLYTPIAVSVTGSAEVQSDSKPPKHAVRKIG